MNTNTDRDESTGNADNRPELRTTSGQAKRRWIVEFTATRGGATGKIKMGAFGDTLDDAKEFVAQHCAGQYDSVTEPVAVGDDTTPAERPTLDDIATGSATPKTMTTINAVEEILGMKVHVTDAVPPDTVVIMPPAERPTLETTTRCPDCGEPVPTVFEHVDGCPPPTSKRKTPKLTPEEQSVVDAYYESCGSGHYGPTVPLDFARRLGRQLAEARENEAAMKRIAVNCQCPSKDAEIAILKGELTEAREQRDLLAEALEWAMSKEPSPCRCLPCSTPPHVCCGHAALASLKE